MSREGAEQQLAAIGRAIQHASRGPLLESVESLVAQLAEAQAESAAKDALLADLVGALRVAACTVHLDRHADHGYGPDYKACSMHCCKYATALLSTDAPTAATQRVEARIEEAVGKAREESAQVVEDYAVEMETAPLTYPNSVYQEAGETIRRGVLAWVREIRDRIRAGKG